MSAEERNNWGGRSALAWASLFRFDYAREEHRTTMQGELIRLEGTSQYSLSCILIVVGDNDFAVRPSHSQAGKRGNVQVHLKKPSS